MKKTTIAFALGIIGIVGLLHAAINTPSADQQNKIQFVEGQNSGYPFSVQFPSNTYVNSNGIFVFAVVPTQIQSPRTNLTAQTTGQVVLNMTDMELCFATGTTLANQWVKVSTPTGPGSSCSH